MTSARPVRRLRSAIPVNVVIARHLPSRLLSAIAIGALAAMALSIVISRRKRSVTIRLRADSSTSNGVRLHYVERGTGERWLFFMATEA